MGIGYFVFRFCGRWPKRYWADENRVYDERKPIEPSYPSVTPSIADFIVASGGTSVNGEGGVYE